MKPGKRLFYFSVLAMASLFAAPSMAGEPNYMTLNGVRTVVVEIDGVRDDFSRYGLQASEIFTRTVDVLRNHGITVAEPAMRSNPDIAVLRVDLNANKNLYNFYMYGLSVELVQKIPLNNPAGGYTSEVVWQEGQTGMVMPTDMRKLNDIVSALLVRFLDDYHAQNPARVSSAR